MADLLHVQVCYATAISQSLRKLTVAQGTTIEQAIAASGILADVPGIDLALQAVGVFGRKRPLETLVREGDRIEIYRPLVADPKETKRRRVEKRAGH
jgi:putative ubiquitin-RnfH superfamily antitoxin RatB of RatAB toxin-antitoxin module